MARTRFENEVRKKMALFLPIVAARYADRHEREAQISYMVESNLGAILKAGARNTPAEFVAWDLATRSKPR